MLFNSLAYILLIMLMRVVQILFSKPAIFLLIGSLVFYLFAGWFDTGIFFVSIIINWMILRFMPLNKWRIGVAVLFNIGILAAFKYLNFFTPVDGENPNTFVDIALPLGISFYTFQILAHQIDVVRGDSKPARSFKSFALFVAFFPQLIAGPIVRSKELLPQIERLLDGHKKKVRLVSYGLALFLLGLFKKVIIADSIAPFVDEIFILGPENMVWAWLGAFLFSFQIYCDFSGYSDMAIGSAYLLGIKLPTNFKTPYLSKGPREFWQRWHITLSTWIRDYLYIGLGGNRGSRYRVGMVLIATMAIAGLWHGADITFVLWGALWGVYIYMGRVFHWIKLPCAAAIAMHFIATSFLWVLFRAPDWSIAYSYYEIMLGISEGSKSFGTFYEQRQLLPVLLLGTIGLYLLNIGEAKIHSIQTLRRLKNYDGALLWGGLIAMIILIILLPVADVNPFIYFRF